MRLTIASVLEIAFALTVLTTPTFASVEDLPIGEAPPDFTLERTDGGEVSLSTEGEGPTVLVFGERSCMNAVHDYITKPSHFRLPAGVPLEPFCGQKAPEPD